MNRNLLDFLKSIKSSYNLADFAKKNKGKALPRSRDSFNKEYEILNQYKQNKISKNIAIEKLINLKKIDSKQAIKILDNLETNVTPMKLK